MFDVSNSDNGGDSKMVKELHDEKLQERVMLLARFMKDEDLVQIALELGLNGRVAEYRERYEEAKKRGLSFYLPSEERERLITEIAEKTADDKLVEIFNKLKPSDHLTDVGCFRGKYYTYYEGKELLLHGSWDEVKRDVFEALEQTKERGYAFLKAIIALTKEILEKRDIEYCYLFGPSYSDILKAMRAELGRFVTPSPRDFAVLKACQIYYKSGSRRYPGHSIPLEILPAVEEALKEWKLKKTITL